jgi:TonB family protein
VSNIGVFDGGDINRVVDNQSVTGYSSTTTGASFFCETHIIYISELQENQFFGFNYYVRSFHRNHYKYLDRLGLKLLVRTPVLINSMGEVSTIQPQRLILLSDFETYNGYAFSESWEKIPGIWSFEFYFKDELIGIVQFDLREKIPEALEERIYSTQIDETAKYSNDSLALEAYLNNETKKANLTLTFGTSAQVVVGFVVNRDGSIGEVSIIKSHSYYLNQEALRIVNGMPNWIPARLKENAVRSTQTISILFENR